jgi:hypothetical protein
VALNHPHARAHDRGQREEAYYKRFPATIEAASDEEEPALPTDQEFLSGFNVKPR